MPDINEGPLTFVVPDEADAPDVRLLYFDDYAAPAAETIPADSAVFIRSTEELWARRTATTAAFPANGVPNDDWFNFGSKDPQTLVLNYIEVTLRSAGTNAGSNVGLEFVDNDGNSYPPGDWVYDANLVQYSGGTATIITDKALFNGTIGLGRNKAGTVKFYYTGKFPNGLSAINATPANGGSSQGVIVTYQGTNYNDSFTNVAAITDPLYWTTSQTVEASDQAATFLEATEYTEGTVFSAPEPDPADPDYQTWFNWVINTGETILDTEVPNGTEAELLAVKPRLSRFGIGTPNDEPEGLRGAPVATLAELTALTARDGETRRVGADWYVFTLGATSGDAADDAATGFWNKVEIYTTIAANEIGAFKAVPNVKTDGTAKFPADYVAEGLLPLINGYSLTNGAVDNPKFAAMFPTFVIGDDLTVPSTFDGRFIRNLGGNAAAFMASQADGTAVNGLRTLRTYVQSDWNGQSNNDFGKGSGSLTGAANNGVGMSSADPETRPHNFAMQFVLVLDSYAKTIMVEPGTLTITNPNEADTTRVLTPNGDGTATFTDAPAASAGPDVDYDFVRHGRIAANPNATLDWGVALQAGYALHTTVTGSGTSASQRCTAQEGTRTATNCPVTILDDVGTGAGTISWTVYGNKA